MKDDPPCQHVTRILAKVAEHFGIAYQTIRDWKRSGMPGQPGHWDLLEIEVWRRKRREGDQPEVPADEVPKDPKRKRDYYLAELARLKVEEAEGKLIPVVEYERALTERSAWITAVLQAVPGTLAPLVAGKSTSAARKVMQQQCRKLQEQAYGKTEE